MESGLSRIKPKRKINIGKQNAELLANPDYSEWDDEELIHGKRRGRRGRFDGPQPKVIPHTLLMELNKRQCSKAYQAMSAAVLDAVTYLTAVVSGKAEPDRDRLHACEVLLNRVLGREPQRLELVEETDPYLRESGGARRAVVLREVIDVESEEFVDPFAEDSEG
jgi:hypothetical protein